MPARICGVAFHGRYRLTESANRIGISKWLISYK